MQDLATIGNELENRHVFLGPELVSEEFPLGRLDHDRREEWVLVCMMLCGFEPLFVTIIAQELADTPALDDFRIRIEYHEFLDTL